MSNNVNKHITCRICKGLPQHISVLKICIKHSFKESMHFGKFGYNTPLHITQRDGYRKHSTVLGPGKQAVFLLKIFHDMEFNRKMYWKKYHAGRNDIIRKICNF